MVTFDPTQPALVRDQLTDKVLHDLLQEDLDEAIRDSVDATLESIVYKYRTLLRSAPGLSSRACWPLSPVYPASTGCPIMRT